MQVSSHGSLRRGRSCARKGEEEHHDQSWRLGRRLHVVTSASQHLAHNLIASHAISPSALCATALTLALCVALFPPPATLSFHLSTLFTILLRSLMAAPLPLRLCSSAASMRLRVQAGTSL
eukprot:3309735-Pleurochrysis_carterae.AAC.1